MTADSSTPSVRPADASAGIAAAAATRAPPSLEITYEGPTDAADGQLSDSMLDTSGGGLRRPDTPMTPASEMCFELRHLDEDDGAGLGLEIGNHVKACVVEIGTLVPYEHLLESSLRDTLRRFYASAGERQAAAAAGATASEEEEPTAEELRGLLSRCAHTRAQELQRYLAARGHTVVWGAETDAPGLASILALDRLREAVTDEQIAASQALDVCTSTLVFLQRLQSQGIQLGMVSAFPHAKRLLERVKVAYLFQSVVTEEAMWHARQRPAPYPDSLLRACSDLGSGTGETVVLESSVEGVAAAREGNMGLIIAVGLTGGREYCPPPTSTRPTGMYSQADMVTHSAATISLTTIVEWFVKGVQKDSWNLEYTTYNPALELTRETLTTVGNGYISSRGCFELYDATPLPPVSPAFANTPPVSPNATAGRAAEEALGGVHYPGHYINGVYGRKKSSVPAPGQGQPVTVENSDLVNCPNWTYIRVFIGEDEISEGVGIDPMSEEILEYSHLLNLKDAVMERRVTYRDKRGRVSRITSSRIVSMDLMHIAAIRFTFQPLNYSDVVCLRSGVDGSVKNSGVRRYQGLESQHLTTVGFGGSGGSSNDTENMFYLLSEVREPQLTVCVACRNTVQVVPAGSAGVAGEVGKADTTANVAVQRGGATVDTAHNKSLIFEDYHAFVDSGADTLVSLDKVVCVYTSRDSGGGREGQIASFIHRGASWVREGSGGLKATFSKWGLPFGGLTRTASAPPPGVASAFSLPVHQFEDAVDVLSEGSHSPLVPEPLAATTSGGGAAADASPSQPQAELTASALAILSDLATFHRVQDPHRAQWQDIWEAAGISIEGDRASQRIVRLHAYHLNVTASSHLSSLDTGFLARGLHGEGYRGHVFWDELHAFPFFLATQPEVCRAHLSYRIKRLPEAQRQALASGYAGAMYPWQSADLGTEVTQTMHFNPYSKKWHADNSHRQRHVNVAVFYDAWRYIRCIPDPDPSTDAGDTPAFRGALHTMMLQIAAFWSSICALCPEDNHYHIRNVMGPDEFHEGRPGADGVPVGVSDNVYTNVMVVWLLRHASDLAAKEGLAAEYPTALWQDITQKMFVPVREDNVLEQFAGFFGLAEMDMGAYRHRVKDLGRMDLLMQSEDKLAGDYQLLKQADTLLLWYLLDVDEVHAILRQLGYCRDIGAVELLRRNYDFYVPRTVDGSSLSLLVHAHIAAELGEIADQWAMFTEASRSDVYNCGGTTKESIHCSVMAGSIAFVGACFAGIRENRAALQTCTTPTGCAEWIIKPNLPQHWTSLSMRKRIKGSDYSFVVTQREVTICREGDPLPSEELVTFQVGSSVVSPGPWLPVTVVYNSLNKIKDFYELMHQTWHHRKNMCYNYFMGGILCDRKQLDVLKHVHTTLSELAGTSGKAKLLLSGRSKINCDLSYEVKELEKDIMMLARGEGIMVSELVAKTYTGFDGWVAKGMAFLEGLRFRSWITDRDGTTNNYCGRYNSSVQSVHNSVWITRFALCCGRSLFITSAPLANPGIVNVSVNFEPAFIYAGSKGREYIDQAGHRRSFTITEEEKQKMERLNARISELCKLPENSQFTLIGSGLQLKFAQTTVARQDIYGTIKRKDSEAFMDTVRALCEEVSPAGFEIIDTGLDIEIMPLKATADKEEERGFDKGDGLKWLNVELGLELEKGPNLITGDTSGDLPMLRESMRQCPDATYAIFVTEDEALMKQVHKLCPRSFIVPKPDILCYLLSEDAKRYVKSACPDDDAALLFPL
eukprot:Rhum_TRINITY_DN8399_c0_g1::Rhum_TRINITY_DN8399_c0_g1_i1::g.27178::m.27178